MNIYHRWYCRTNAWRRRLQGTYMPAVLASVDLGEDVLEIGPGPGIATEWLRERVTRLTSLEIDHKLAESLKRRMAGTNVTVVEGDATDMPFPDGSFSAVVSFTMLHHVPTPELQDRLLRESCRVLRPGGWFAGMDSTPNLLWRLYHLFDTGVAADPDTFDTRLEAAGFGEVSVRRGPSGFGWRAKRV